MAALVGPDPAFWSGKRVLLTGQTGFKGAWLWLWLRHLGAEPFGLALAPATIPSLYDLAAIGQDATSRLADIRDRDAVARLVDEAAPDIVLHLAAQALVRRSYAEPVETVATNVLGTINVLEAVRTTPCVKAVVSVTTDKCYLNREWVWPYREDDALGGYDPYSASKACAEIVTAAWRQSFLGPRGVGVATARAGNVIGGGDWSPDRLVPDCLAALGRGESIPIRNPRATRPWQHVLEPLCGYLLLAERLYGESGPGAAEAWNFGPDMGDVQPVSTVVVQVVDLWGGEAAWHLVEGAQPHEAGLLAVDASKARARLGWQPRLGLRDALAWTVEWQRRHLAGEPAAGLVLDQISRYESLGCDRA
ncbi:CDP-glucose 4,6-dehydratase [uncultured Enterovirga sp.]|uniref:CDP-glucose 4,6-dehydratase n=1 Tax=uncultured Enterovirga sp. TaxID=2026352 RepID=UPI0035C9C2ED